MRRVSLPLAIAAVLITIVVAFTYKYGWEKAHARRNPATPQIKIGEEGLALSGWTYSKDDPETNRPVVRVKAASFRATHDPSTFELQALALKLYAKKASTYTYVKCEKALFDERSGVMKSEGAVSIVMNVPVDKDAEDKDELAKRVRVQTSGVTYETKSFKAYTDQPASFIFPDGDGKSVGVEYDPNQKTLHMKSQVSLDRFSRGTSQNKMHVEAGDLIYKEAEQKIYLSPWSKMQREGLNIQAQSSVITLQDGVLRQIDSDRPLGSDDRKDRHVEYSAEKMTALFDADGNMVEVAGDKNARVTSAQPGSKTVVTGDKADLRFDQKSTTADGKDKVESYLHSVTADGHAVAESTPLPLPGIQLAETRILKSEHIELAMKPGGQDVEEIRTVSQAQLEFKPNRPDQSHRILDCSRLRIVYGEKSYIDTFMGWNAATRTEKPADAAPVKSGPPKPALTWSDVMRAKFQPNSSEIANIEQTGNFRYQEGDRKAWANKALLEQKLNRITLTGKARVLDSNGSATGDVIVMNQQNGDMDATGRVLSTHAPDKNQKPGTSMLDTSQPMQATADKMQTRENNDKVFYQGHAVMWQGANRISADKIDIGREQQVLHAVGNVVSELVDNKAVPADPKAPASDPIYTTVKAPELLYRDDTREALYTGGVTLLRNSMTVTSKKMLAVLTPKTDKGDSSSLDHAFADGDVLISDKLAGNRTRVGSAEHAEYYTKEDKVVLNGGAPQMADSQKGVTKGRQLTYFSGDDHLVVEGELKKVAFTQMKKK